MTNYANNPQDYEVSVSPSRQQGGQQVTVTDTTIIVKHIPTGITASCGFEISQHRNKAVAIEMIEWALASLRINRR